ncbi:MAG: phosphoglycerate kinase [Patescibacteria group bacterium]|nr:phosphoglycerate kinase [Patescibacteria group bacterium]
MKLHTLDDLKDVAGKRVLLRVDYNVPVIKGKVGPKESIRLQASLPTLRYLLSLKAKVILVSHLGRPKGPDRKHSLKPVADRLEKLLRRDVTFIRHSIEDERVDDEIRKLKNGQVALLENIRFYPGEEKNDTFLSKRLAELADIYVNDAFATAHRKHASTAGVTKYLPSYAGRLMAVEITNLLRLIRKPKKPFVVLMGGAKMSSKLPTMKKLLSVADKIMVGGGMANAFFRAKGLSTGKSEMNRGDVVGAKKLLKNKKIMLPVDVLVATTLDKKARVRVTSPCDVRKNEYVVDIGPETVGIFAAEVKKARTIAWNGPMGLFEVKKFSHGSIALGRFIASRSSSMAYGVVGGGETIVALEMTGMEEFVDHVSTGGGAMLEFLAGKTLPGIEPLMS